MGQGLWAMSVIKHSSPPLGGPHPPSRPPGASVSCRPATWGLHRSSPGGGPGVTYPSSRGEGAPSSVTRTHSTLVTHLSFTSRARKSRGQPTWSHTPWPHVATLLRAGPGSYRSSQGPPSRPDSEGGCDPSLSTPLCTNRIPPHSRVTRQKVWGHGHCLCFVPTQVMPK